MTTVIVFAAIAGAGAIVLMQPVSLHVRLGPGTWDVRIGFLAWQVRLPGASATKRPRRRPTRARRAGRARSVSSSRERRPFGEPLEVQGTTIIPVCKMSIGYGGGGGEGEGTGGQKPTGKGTGGGGGGTRIEPAALIIARNGEISVIGIGTKNPRFETLLERVPHLIEKLQSKRESRASDSD
jgi:uncharacterized spore protein YtfJ